MDPQHLDQWDDPAILAPVENPRFFLPEQPPAPVQSDGCAIAVVEVEEFRARWWPASDPA